MVKKKSIESSLKRSSIYNYRDSLAKELIKNTGSCVIVSILIALTMSLTSTNLSNNNTLVTFIGTISVYAASLLTLHNLGKHPGNRPTIFIVPVISLYFFILITIYSLVRIDYSRTVLFEIYILMLAASYITTRQYKRNQTKKYGVIPSGFYKRLIDLNKDTFFVISEANDLRVDGIIVDSNERLDSKWQAIVADCLAKGIPVIDSVFAYEAITGKSPIDHYGELASHETTLPRSYMGLKRIIDILLVFGTSPITLPLVLLVALLIKIESRGPAFFIQKRVGQGGSVFNMYKLRSMEVTSERNGAQFAQKNDPRVTKVGRIIRKTRIDELPQFLNVLIGDMSLIGPRPEQQSFVIEFEKKIPLYNYRHVVKPGITGWAQVTQGYASNEDQTREKLSHDFYYVKNVSLWLDVDITIKTILTMITGFGAR